MGENQTRIYDADLARTIADVMDVAKELSKTEHGTAYAVVQRIDVCGDGYRLGYVTIEDDFPVFVYDYSEDDTL